MVRGDTSMAEQQMKSRNMMRIWKIMETSKIGESRIREIDIAKAISNNSLDYQE